jgi:hypothetical protein
MHPAIKVQFELDMEYGDAALQCKQCYRPKHPDSKFPERLPPKRHPPQACGMTIFGSSNKVEEVRRLAEQHNASLVILLRRNHVAHAISAYRHFARVPRHMSRQDLTVPWGLAELQSEASKQRDAYERLLQYAQTGRPTHIIFYEDLKARPGAVWDRLQAFLGVSRQELAGIEGLEAKSSSKPSIEYLARKAEVQAGAAGTEWGEMVREAGYDEGVDLAGEFGAICGRMPGAALSWREHVCVDGKALPLFG